MAFITCDFFSDVLKLSTSVNVILPQKTKKQIGMEGSAFKSEFPVLYLLHGLSDDHTIWQRRTSIERYVADKGIAVVMPNGGRSFYTKMAHGPDYFKFMTEELPFLMKSFFHISDKREDTFVAGLSMGGYGSLKLALSCPDKYAAAASLSGAVNIANITSNIDFNIISEDELRNIFGDYLSVKGTDNDLFHLAKQLKESGKDIPLLYQCCGTEDFLYEDNLIFRNYAKELPLPLTYTEEPGIHDWYYWDKKIQDVLNWLPIK